MPHAAPELPPVAAALVAARTRLALSQRAAAALIGMPASQLARYETGTNAPGVDALERIGAAYGVTAADLLGAAPAPTAVAGPPPGYYAGRMDEIADALEMQVARLRAVSAMARAAGQAVPITPYAIPPEGVSRTLDSLTPEELAHGLDLAPTGSAADAEDRHAKPRRRRANGA